MKFRFVDKILSWTPYERIVGLKALSFEEYSLKEAFGEEAHLPETLLLESFLQLGNWLILLSSGFTQMGLAVRISRVHFHDYLRPGQQLRLEVRLQRRREDGFELSGTGWVGERTLITGHGCLATPVPASDYLNPEDWRVLFSEIVEPSQAPTP